MEKSFGKFIFLHIFVSIKKHLYIPILHENLKNKECFPHLCYELSFVLTNVYLCTNRHRQNSQTHVE